MRESLRPRKSRLWLVLALAATGAVAIAATIVAAVSLMNPAVGTAPAPSSSPSLRDGQPHVLSEADLRDFGVENGPVYWAGPREGVRYELTYTTAGWIYIRYLPAEASDVADDETYLTVGNYVVADGYDQLIEWGSAEGYSIVQTQSGAAIVTQNDDPLRAYFAFPDVALQVEVFDPEEGAANALASDGSIVLLGNTE